MGIRDNKLQPDSNIAPHARQVSLVTAINLTDVFVDLFAPGHEFLVQGAEATASAVAGAVALNSYVVPGNGVFGATAGLAIDAAPEKFKTTNAFMARVGMAFFAKAIVTAQTFTAAHVVSASKFGIILIQMTKAGVVTTKCPGATQTTPMAYTSANAARAALPAPTTGNISLGYILIAAKAATWTANTDDMTNGSDLTTATFVSTGLVQPAGRCAAAVPVGGELVVSAAPSMAAGWGGPNAVIVTAITTDGTGAAVDLHYAIKYRPFPLDGEYSRQ